MEGAIHVSLEISSKLAVSGRSEKACEIFPDIFPLDIPIRFLERILENISRGVAAIIEEKPAQELDPEAMITVATLDKEVW